MTDPKNPVVGDLFTSVDEIPNPNQADPRQSFLTWVVVAIERDEIILRRLSAVMADKKIHTLEEVSKENG
jgi:hypothetical protein